MDPYAILECTLSLVALINPISKIFVLSTLTGKDARDRITRVALKSSLIAWLILISFIFIGNFLLSYVFHVQIYSFMIAGGIVLSIRGIEALNKGLFFEVKHKQKIEELSIVPLASPLIAGPATITAAVSFPTKYGIAVTAVAMTAAIVVNLVLMLASKNISGYLVRHNTMGALIRITGLIVATIGIQMALDGFAEYTRTL